MRWRLATLILTIVVVAGAGTAYVASRHQGTSTRTPSRSSPSPEPGQRVGPLGTLAAAASPTPAGMARALRRVTTDPALGGGLHALVVDATTGQVLLQRDATARVPPASSAKLLTAVAALRTLGAATTIPTVVSRSGNTLYLRGGGDVTLAAHPVATFPAPADLETLARDVAEQLPAPARVRLRYDAGGWSGPTSAPGWSPIYFSEGDVSRLTPLEVDEGRQGRDSQHLPRAADPARQAADDFVTALDRVGVRVIGPARSATTPTSATQLAEVSSPPIAALVQRMLTVSDNDLAEALGRLIAVHEHAPPTFAGAGAAVVAAVRAAGIDTTGAVLHDGSGLSRLDRVTPRLLASVVRAAIRQPALRPLLLGLPVAGFTGTLGDRYRGRARPLAGGVVRAKTGTLAGVNALAGEVVDADGRLLVFALVTDRAGDPTPTERALDRIATALAACGCR